MVVSYTGVLEGRPKHHTWGAAEGEKRRVDCEWLQPPRGTVNHSLQMEQQKTQLEERFWTSHTLGAGVSSHKLVLTMCSMVVQLAWHYPYQNQHKPSVMIAVIIALLLRSPCPPTQHRHPVCHCQNVSCETTCQTVHACKCA